MSDYIERGKINNPMGEDYLKKIELHWIFRIHRLTQAFGPTEFAKQHLHDIYISMKGHEGLDWGFSPGEAVRVAHDGIVVQDIDENLSAYGIHVVVWDPKQEIATWYCHLQRNTVKIEQQVRALEIIGFSGNTAGRSSKSTGPHLHFGLCRTKEGIRINRENGYLGFINPLLENVKWLDKIA